MSYAQIGKLIDKWLHDPKFRVEFRKDFEETLEKSGISLSHEELAALKKVDWNKNKSDQELPPLISKPLM